MFCGSHIVKFIIKDVCLNTYKFGCNLMQLGALPKVGILGMVLLYSIKLLIDAEKTSFPFCFFIEAKGQGVGRRLTEKRRGYRGKCHL